MSKRTDDALITAALLDLDPAPATSLTSAEQEHAEATLARILTTPRGADDPAPQPRRRRWHLLVPAALAGAATVVVPVLLLGGGTAFATWTPTPVPLEGAARTDAATACRGQYAMPDQGERTLIAERRGGWTYVLISGGKAEAACLMNNDFVTDYPRADESTGFFGTYDPDHPKAPTVARNQVLEYTSGAGSFRLPGRWPFHRDGWFNWVEGYVGSDVARITVDPPTGPDVEASVANGRYAAWWPSPTPSSKNPEAQGAWSYTVTLVDGSTRPYVP